MVFFRIVPEHLGELLEQDSAWIAGHFELGDIDHTVCFFKDRHCMLLPTLSDFLDFLLTVDQYNGKRIDWLGTDNGKSVSLTRQKGVLIIGANRFQTTFHLHDVQRAVLQGAEQFFSHWQAIHLGINQNPLVMDLLDKTEHLKRLF
jgi:hypothetical protein